MIWILDNSLYAFLAFGLSFVCMLSTRVAPLFVIFNKIVTFEKKKKNLDFLNKTNKKDTRQDEA